MNANDTLKAAAAKRDTATLLGALYILEAKGQGNLTNEERMVKAATADAIIERHGIEDLANEIFDDLEFVGTYTDAIEIALAKVAA